MTLRLKGNYSVSAAENPSRQLILKPITCNVVFLDDKSELFKLEKNVRGQVLIDLVFDYLELLERDFFGLQYNDFSSDPGPLVRWLDPSKALKKQLKGLCVFIIFLSFVSNNWMPALSHVIGRAIAHTLWFRVKFYVPDPIFLEEEFTRYLVYLQVRRDVLNGSLTAPNSILAKLAGLCLQSELGDYSVADCKPGYMKHIRLVPNQTSDFEAEATEAHVTYRSYVPAAAELEFLNIARCLDRYGVHTQEVTDRQRNRFSIGVSARGIGVFRDAKRIFLYTWENIDKISFSGKNFSIRLKHLSRAASLSKVDHSFELSNTASGAKIERNASFIFGYSKQAKIFWQFAVTCHAFFRVKEPSWGSTFPTTFRGKSGRQANPISASSAAFSNISAIPNSSSSPGGFSRFFFPRSTQTRRSLSIGPGGPGLERTMSTLMELRRRSKSIERGFSRGVSRRFTRRRSYATLGSTQTVNILNAYESRDSIGMQSIHSLLGGTMPEYMASSPEKEDITPSEDGTHENHLNSKNILPSKANRTFPRQFRSSAPPLSRIKNTDISAKIAPSTEDRLQNTSPSKENGKFPSVGGTTRAESFSPSHETRRKKDSQRTQIVGRENVVLPRPTTLISGEGKSSSIEETRQNKLLRLSSSSKTKSCSSSRPSAKSPESPHHAETPLPRNSYDAESSESPNDADEDLLVRGNTEDNFGFEIPRKKGQNVVIGREMPEHTYQQVTNSNRGVVDDHWGFLEVAERPSGGVYINESTADGRLKDVGETVSRHPKSSSTITEVRQVKRELSSSSSKVWLPSNVEGFKGSSQKRYLNSPSPGTQPAGIVISRSPSTTPNTTSCGGARKVLTSNIEQLHHSIQAIENGLANRSLVRQFEMLKPRNSKSTMKDSQNQDNKPKNRYRDISPYDQTRVKIQGISGDYINASLIKLEIPKSNLLKEYIAAQGPLPNTCVDFWEMCWEQKSELIVMLTCVKEQGRVKCHKYWPDVNQIFEYSWIQSKSSTKGNTTFRKRITLRITNTKEDVGEEIALREFLLQREISPTNDMVPSSTSINTWRPRILTTTGDNKVFKANCNSETRRIVQLQYITWPDHGVPDHCDDLIDFVERMRQLRGEDSSVPAVVHCSAGIGRTGVVILLDTAMDIIRSGMPINPVEMVGQMRDYREMLIQTSTQFVFVCEAIVKYYSDVILKQLRARSR